MSIEQSDKSTPQAAERPDIDNKMMDEALVLMKDESAARNSENGKDLGPSTFTSKPDHDIFACVSIVGDNKYEISKCSSQIPREPGKVFLCANIIKEDSPILAKDTASTGRGPWKTGSEEGPMSSDMSGDKMTKPEKDLTEEQIHDDLDQALKSADEKAIQGVLAEVDTKEEMDALDAAVEQLNKENKGTGVDLSVVGRVGNAKLNIHAEDHNNGIGCGGQDSITNIHLSDDSAEATFWTNSGIVQNPEREIDAGNAMKRVQEALQPQK